MIPVSARLECLSFSGLSLWEASLFHAYYSTIRKRQQDGTRHEVDLAVQINASELGQRCAIVRTRNLSKTGACLVASSVLTVNTQLTIAFDGQPTNKARVIWSKPAGNGTENLVGVEFTPPLAALSRS